MDDMTKFYEDHFFANSFWKIGPKRLKLSVFDGVTLEGNLVKRSKE